MTKGDGMSWLGKWRNQYGSILEITDESNHRIVGRFRTALPDSGFFGHEIEVIGVHYGDCIGVTAGGHAPQGDTVVTYTGLLREGRLETLWYVVADAVLTAPKEGAPAENKKLNWWRSVTTNADTFARVTD
jgi:hypothetical protein